MGELAASIARAAKHNCNRKPVRLDMDVHMAELFHNNPAQALMALQAPWALLLVHAIPCIFPCLHELAQHLHSTLTSLAVLLQLPLLLLLLTTMVLCPSLRPRCLVVMTLQCSPLRKQLSILCTTTVPSSLPTHMLGTTYYNVIAKLNIVFILACTFQMEFPAHSQIEVHYSSPALRVHAHTHAHVPPTQTVCAPAQGLCSAQCHAHPTAQIHACVPHGTWRTWYPCTVCSHGQLELSGKIVALMVCAAVGSAIHRPSAQQCSGLSCMGQHPPTV
jgi:hypothetical protein